MPHVKGPGAAVTARDVVRTPRGTNMSNVTRAPWQDEPEPPTKPMTPTPRPLEIAGGAGCPSLLGRGPGLISTMRATAATTAHGTQGERT